MNPLDDVKSILENARIGQKELTTTGSKEESTAGSNTLSSSLSLSNDKFIALITQWIPEVQFLNKKANATVEGVSTGKITNLYGITEPEAIRAWAGLIAFKCVWNASDEDYAYFISSQAKEVLLSQDAFKSLSILTKSLIKTEEDLQAAFWSILCNDLGKVEEVAKIHSNLTKRKSVFHDTILADLLTLKPEIFPGFMKLTQKHRKAIIDGFLSGCDLGQYEQLEMAPPALLNLAKLDKFTRDLYYVHSIFDVMGAAAHFFPAGSRTFHQQTATLFMTTKKSIDLLDERFPEKTFRDAYTMYLTERLRLIGISENHPDAFALGRIAGIGRFFTKEQGEELLAAWASLEQSERDIIKSELSADEGIFLGYGPTLIVNAQNAIARETNNTLFSKEAGKARLEGLCIALRHFAVVFKGVREIIGFKTRSDAFVAECSDLASHLGKNPRATIGMAIECHGQVEGRIFCKFVAPKPEIGTGIATVFVPQFNSTMADDRNANVSAQGLSGNAVSGNENGARIKQTVS